MLFRSLWQFVALELKTGDIDGDPELAEPLCRPAPGFADGGVHRPESDLARQAHRLQNRHELCRRDRAADRMIPADKRLRAAYAAFAGSDQRLECQAQLAKFDAGDRQVPIRVQLTESARADAQMLQALRVPTASGASVPLASVAAGKVTPTATSER